jgi:hypothetical protein
MHVVDGAHTMVIWRLQRKVSAPHRWKTMHSNKKIPGAGYKHIAYAITSAVSHCIDNPYRNIHTPPHPTRLPINRGINAWYESILKRTEHQPKLLVPIQMMSHKELEKWQDFSLFHEALGLIATGLEMKQSQRRWCSRLRKDFQRLIG